MNSKTDHHMELKKNIKNKVDKLNNHELRSVELFIDSFKRKKHVTIKKSTPSKIYPYQEVIQLMGNDAITSNDIKEGREERI